jgi:type IV secretion system protein VirD4
MMKNIKEMILNNILSSKTKNSKKIHKKRQTLNLSKCCRWCKKQYENGFNFNLLKSTYIRKFCIYFSISIVILFYCQISSIVFLGLSDHSIASPLPTTIIISLIELIKQIGLHYSINYLIAIIALFSPCIVLSMAYLSFRYYHYQGLKYFLVSLSALLLWLSLSDSLIQYFLNQSVNFGNPLRYLSYWLLFAKDNTIASHLILAALLSSIPFILLLSLENLSFKKIPNIYGKARFASFYDIKKHGLFAKEGIYLGRAFHREIILPGYEHTLLFGPTGSGKTDSNAIINLLLWLSSCVTLDLKLTLFKYTSGYRQSIGHQVYVFSPGSPFSHGFNALDFISSDPIKRIDEVQRIAQILIPDNQKVSDPFWYQNARFILIALIHYVLDVKEHRKTLGEINLIVKSTGNFSEFAKLASERTDIHYIAKNNFLRFLNTNHKTHKNIIDTLLTYLAIFDNPLIEAATDHSDFDIRKLRQEKITIYVGVNPADLERLAPLISIFYEQVVDVMLRTIPDKNEPYDLLLQIDEFASLRRMESYLKIGIFREYRIRALLYIQDLSQLYSKYGRDDAKIFLNAKARIAYTQIDLESSKYLESCLGTKTIEVKNSKKNNKDEAVSYASRPLMLAQEIRAMSKNKMLILIEGCHTILAKKVFWHSYKQYRKKILQPINIPSLKSLAQQLFDRAKLISNKTQQELLKNIDDNNLSTNNDQPEMEPPHLIDKKNEKDETKELDDML